MRKVIIILFASFIAFCSSAQTLKEQALSKIDTLNYYITKAEAKGIDATREKAAVRTAEVFLEYADWDEAHIAKNTELFGMAYGFKDKPEYWANLLADFERSDVIQMLDESTDFVKKVIDGTYTRRPAVKLDWSSISLVDDQLTQDGAPVFLCDYTWKPGISKLTDYFGHKDGAGAYVTWVKDKNGTLNSYRINQLKAKGDGRVGFVFLGHENPASWAKEAYGEDFRLTDLTAKYPDYYSGEVSRYTDYDIDNPAAKEMLGYLLKGVVPHMAGKNYTEMGYMLCNEPHFYANESNGKPDWASSHVTEYTLAKFLTWLKEKHDTISNLNQLWGTSFESFDDVTLKVPIATETRGSAQWYDWNRFNNHRVLEWYTWMKSEIRKYDPEAKAQLKIMPNLWSNNTRGSGIDLEALTELSEIIGNDCGSHYNNVWSWKHPEWPKTYQWDWRELAMSYDFMKSISPEKAMINSESHFLSKSSSRDLYMKPEYARVTSWIAHLKGLTYQQVWYWNRLEDGSPKTSNKSHAGSNIQQPRVTNEMAQTYYDLNAFGEEIMAFQRMRKPIRIFYSETSAINKTNHMDDVFDLYEELVFNGVPLGFATQNIIEKQDNNAWDVILVRKTEYVTEAELIALQTYLNNGGTIIIDDVSLKKDEYKKGLSALEAGSGTIIKASTAAEFKSEAYSILEGKNQLPGITLSEKHTGLHDGCMWNLIKQEDGSHVLFVTNVGNTVATIDIELKNASIGTHCKDLFRGIGLPTQLTVKPYDMFFLEITDDEEVTSAVPVEKADHNAVQVFPNPFSKSVSIHLGDHNYETLRMLNMNGQEVFRRKIDGQKQFLVDGDINSLNNGLYTMEITGKTGTFHKKVLKH